MRSQSKENVQNLLAGNRAVADEILREKDTNVGGTVHADRREYDRFQYQVPQGLIFKVKHPGGTDSAFLVQPYNLSQGGIGFIHGGYIYPGSRCSIDLLLPDGSYKTTTGTVVRCSLLRGRVHDIGLKFDSPVKHGWYDNEPDAEQAAADPNLPSFEGAVLFFTQSKGERELIRHLIGRLKATIVTASNSADALQAIEQQRFDVVLVSLWDSEGSGGMELIKALAAKKYPYPVIGAVGDGGEPVHKAARDNGCTEVIDRIYDQDQLIGLLGKYLQSPDGVGGGGKGTSGVEPLLSSRWSDVQLRPLIMHYLETLERQIQTIQQILNTEDPLPAKQLCRDIKITSEAYGFEPISQAIITLQPLIGDKDKNDAIRSAITELTSLCTRACRVKHDAKP